MDIVCIEFYGMTDPEELMAAMDVPEDSARSHAIKIGKYLCKIWGRGGVNAVILDADGEVIERLLVSR